MNANAFDGLRNVGQVIGKALLVTAHTG